MSAFKRDTLLWCLDLKNTIAPQSYLFGSMHLQKKEAVHRCSALASYIGKCTNYAAEIDLGDSNISDFPVHKILNNAFSLKAQFRTNPYEKYRKIIRKAFHIDIFTLDHLPPIMITQFISEALLTESAVDTVDSYLWKMAGDLDKSRLGVESYMEQYEIMLKIPLEIQIKSLKSIARNVSRFKKDLEKTCHLYQEQKIDQLYKMTKRQLGGLRHLLLYRRNERMADSIHNMISDAPSFVAVGAAHLSGKYGLLRLLKIKGYQIQPIHNWE